MDPITSMTEFSNDDCIKRLSDSSDKELFSHWHECSSEDAFQELVQRYWPLVMGVCTRLWNGNPLRGEEAAHTVFVMLFRWSHSIRSVQALPRWLHQTAINVVNRQKRHDLKHRRLLKNYDSYRVKETAESGESEIIAHIDSTIDRLSKSLQSVIILHYLQGKAIADVAVELKISQGAVRKRLHVAREKMRKLLNGKGFSIESALFIQILNETFVATHTPSYSQGLILPGSFHILIEREISMTKTLTRLFSASLVAVCISIAMCATIFSHYSSASTLVPADRIEGRKNHSQKKASSPREEDADDLDKESRRAIELVQCFVSEFQAGRVEPIMAIISTPFYFDRKMVFNVSSELRATIEEMVAKKGGKELGDISYEIKEKVLNEKMDIKKSVWRSIYRCFCKN